MIAAIDLGTSVTKVAFVDEDGVVGVGRCPIDTRVPRRGWAEQDATTWWPSVVTAWQDARAGVRAAGARTVDAVGFSAARITLATLDAAGTPTGPALVWSDHRASEEAEWLSRTLDGSTLRQRTGSAPGPGSTAAKIAWLVGHEPDRWRETRWLCSPRDFLVWRLTGRWATDTTMASATGLYDSHGDLVEELAGAGASRLPDVAAPTTVVGGLLPEPASLLGARERGCRSSSGPGTGRAKPLGSEPGGIGLWRRGGPPRTSR